MKYMNEQLQGDYYYCYYYSHLEDEEREGLEIRRCRRLQQEWEKGKLATWNWSTERGGEEKKIALGTEKCENIKNRYIYKNDSIYKLHYIHVDSEK